MLQRSSDASRPPIVNPKGNGMSEDFLYTVSRFGVGTDDEALIERAELVREYSQLILRIAGQTDRTLTTTDVSVAIAEEPILSEIRANQITRIKAQGAALDLLPFVLSVPGHPDDFDEALWSTSLADLHTHQEWVVQPGRYRVAYVNDFRWCAWPTIEGPRMLPEQWPMVGLNPIWTNLTFSELGGMTSGLDEVSLGIVTQRVAAACHNADSSSLKVALWQRSGDAAEDSQIIVDWLLDWVPTSFGVTDDGLKALLVQLFVEATWNGRNGNQLQGSWLCAGSGAAPPFGDTDTSQWCLEASLPRGATSLAFELIAERGERLSAIVEAARIPTSAAGLARGAALVEWENARATYDGEADESDEADYDEEDYEPDSYDEDSSAPWNHSPISRMPRSITAGKIPIQLWRRYTQRGKPIASDFVFTWDGGRKAHWRYGIDPDDSDGAGLPKKARAAFSGDAEWTDGVNVALTYSSTELSLEGNGTLDAAAPTRMDPSSNERAKMPQVWVDLASKIVDLLDKIRG